MKRRSEKMLDAKHQRISSIAAELRAIEEAMLEQVELGHTKVTTSGYLFTENVDTLRNLDYDLTFTDETVGFSDLTTKKLTISWEGV